MEKTVRLLFPEWQGGNNPTYYLGAQLLSWLAPKNEHHKEIEIQVKKPQAAIKEETKAVVAQTELKVLAESTYEILELEKPDKVITLGGDCLVSQSPFDYLHGRYGDELGIIWIDAHPDVSTPEVFNHEHAMVLGNLLGQGDPAFSSIVKNPFEASEVLYVGLQQPNDAEVRILADLKLSYAVQQDTPLKVEDIQKWIRQKGFKKIAVHLDLDVLDPQEFRMLYFAEPRVNQYDAAGGKMSLQQLAETMAGISAAAEIVGLTIAELLPWDVQNLNTLLAGFDIFK